jgi:hypothetical protein
MAGLQSYEELDANLKEYTEQLEQVRRAQATLSLAPLPDARGTRMGAPPCGRSP